MSYSIQWSIINESSEPNHILVDRGRAIQWPRKFKICHPLVVCITPWRDNPIAKEGRKTVAPVASLMDSYTTWIVKAAWASMSTRLESSSFFWPWGKGGEQWQIERHLSLDPMDNLYISRRMRSWRGAHKNGHIDILGALPQPKIHLVSPSDAALCLCINMGWINRNCSYYVFSIVSF